MSFRKKKSTTQKERKKKRWLCVRKFSLVLGRGGKQRSTLPHTFKL